MGQAYLQIILYRCRENFRFIEKDRVGSNDLIYTVIDVYKRQALERGEDLPFDPKDATIYYVGPTPAKPGQVIGSAGPTTSGRMDAYAPTMMSVGARGMIGKDVYKRQDTDMPGGFERTGDMFRLLDKPGLGLEISF